jgi:hypothetical protein
MSFAWLPVTKEYMGDNCRYPRESPQDFFMVLFQVKTIAHKFSTSNNDFA